MLAGASYSDALSGVLDPNTSLSGEFDLSRCNGFSATIGLSGSADPSSTVRFTATKDDVVTDLGTWGEGARERIYVGTAGGSHLMLQTDRVTGEGSATAVWAAPEVLCLEAP